MGNSCCTISGEDFNKGGGALDNFWECCKENNCCIYDDKVGYGACDNWSDLPLASYKVCENSCHGDSSCHNIGGNYQNLLGLEVEIGPGSCVEKNSCTSLCDSTERVCTVGEKSCVGTHACYDIGYDSPNDKVEIGSDSCIGDSACQYVGEYSKSYVIIGDGACKQGDYACQEVGFETEDGIIISDGACMGTEACSFLGYYTQTDQVYVGLGACVGDYACYDVGYEAASEGVNVGSNACQGDSACYNFGYYNKFVEVRPYVCRDGNDSECHNCFSSDAGVDSPSYLVATNIPSFACPYK